MKTAFLRSVASIFRARRLREAGAWLPLRGSWREATERVSRRGGSKFFALSGALHHLPLSGRQVFAWLALRESCHEVTERVNHGIRWRKRCLIHKTKCGNSNTTLRDSGRIMEVKNFCERPKSAVRSEYNGQAFTRKVTRNCTLIAL